MNIISLAKSVINALSPTLIAVFYSITLIKTEVRINACKI